MPRPSHPLHFILIMLGKEYKSQCSLWCSFLHPLVTSYLLGPNIHLSTLSSNTLSLCSSLKVRDQVSHPYITSGKIITLHILIVAFFDSRWKDTRFWAKWWLALPEFNLLLISSWIKFWLLLLSPNIWTVTHFQMICLLFSCPDFDLHSGDETATHT
jgi:hypothetical protein